MGFFEKIRIGDVYVALKQILNILSRPLWVDPTTGRVNINNATSVTTVTTVSTVTTVGTVTSTTNLVNLGGFDAKQTLLYSNERANWNIGVRSRIN